MGGPDKQRRGSWAASTGLEVKRGDKSENHIQLRDNGQRNPLARPHGRIAPGVLSSTQERAAAGGTPDIIDKAGCGWPMPRAKDPGLGGKAWLAGVGEIRIGVSLVRENGAGYRSTGIACV